MSAFLAGFLGLGFYIYSQDSILDKRMISSKAGVFVNSCVNFSKWRMLPWATVHEFNRFNHEFVSVDPMEPSLCVNQKLEDQAGRRCS